MAHRVHWQQWYLICLSGSTYILCQCCWAETRSENKGVEGKFRHKTKKTINLSCCYGRPVKKYFLFFLRHFKCWNLGTSGINEKYLESFEVRCYRRVEEINRTDRVRSGDVDGTRWRTGWDVKGKLTNGVGSHYHSHYLGTWCIQHYYRWCEHLGRQ